MNRARRSISVMIQTLDRKPKGYGVLYGLTTREAHMATSAELPAGARFRFRLFHHDPPRLAERWGKVLWTREVFNLDEQLFAECRIEWVSADNSDGVESHA